MGVNCGTARYGKTYREVSIAGFEEATSFTLVTEPPLEVAKLLRKLLS